MRATQSGTGHFPQLDGLRAIAVAGPVIWHLWPRNIPASPYTQRVLNLGSIGVDLFFVISGFLITLILLRAREGAETIEEGRLPVVRAFVVRRVLRIFPIYLLALAVLDWTHARAFAPVAGWCATYTLNFWIAKHGVWPGPYSHFWSLAVEEQFYLVWPWIVLFLPKRTLPKALLVAFLLGPLSRWVLLARGMNEMGVVVLPFSCLDDLAGGGLVAWLWTRRASSPKWVDGWIHALFWVGLVGTGFNYARFIHGRPGALVGGSVFFRFFAALLFMGVVGRAAGSWRGVVGTVLDWRPVQYVGRISYGIYLYHLLLPLVVTPAFIWWVKRVGPIPDRRVMFFAAVCLVTLLLATVSWYGFERPINRLKRRFPYVPRLAIRREGAEPART